MASNRNTVQQRLQTIPPKCLLHTSPTVVRGIPPTGDMVVAGWSLSGPSGNLCYSVLGVPTLINSDPASTLLFGPLAVQDNKGLIEIFDPSVHGYHNENAKLEECLGDE